MSETVFALILTISLCGMWLGFINSSLGKIAHELEKLNTMCEKENT